MTVSVLKPTIQDHDNTYELTRVHDPLGNHFIIKGEISINPNDFFTITLSGFEEFDEDSLTTIVHPTFLRPQPDRFGNQVIYFPINSKLDVCIQIIQVINDDVINNAPQKIKDRIFNKGGWIACSCYEVIGKSNNSISG